MEFTLNHFEICGIDGMTHVVFKIVVNGEEIERNCPLRKENEEDVILLQSIEQFIKSKVGEKR